MKTLSHIIFLASPLPALRRWLPADAPRGQADPSIIILWRVEVEALRLGCRCRLSFAVCRVWVASHRRWLRRSRSTAGAGSAVAAIEREANYELLDSCPPPHPRDDQGNRRPSLSESRAKGQLPARLRGERGGERAWRDNDVPPPPPRSWPLQPP